MGDELRNKGEKEQRRFRVEYLGSDPLPEWTTGARGIEGVAVSVDVGVFASTARAPSQMR